MDKEEYTFEEIVGEMQMSKSSVSTALKNPELRGVPEYVTYPGDRKRYFRFISTELDLTLAGRSLNQAHLKTGTETKRPGRIIIYPVPVRNISMDQAIKTGCSLIFSILKDCTFI